MQSNPKTTSFARMKGAALLLSLLFLSGCAGVAPSKKEVVQQKTAAQEKTAEGVTAPQNGFTVTDTARIAPDAQEDFDSALEALTAGETDKGIALLEKVTKTSPNAVAPFINLGMAYKKIDKLDRAEENLKAAIKLNPDHPVANNEYGMVYRKSGRFAEAKATYEKILTKYPDFQPARKNLGVLCDLYLRDPECALQHYQVYSAAIPDDKQVKLWIADLQRRLGK